MSDIPAYNIVWHQGRDMPINFQYLKEGVAQNLASAEMRMDIFKFGATTPFYVVDSGPGGEAVLTAEGYVNILLPRALTLPGGIFYGELAEGNASFIYDLFIRVNDLQDPVLKGKIKLERSLTLWP